MSDNDFYCDYECNVWSKCTYAYNKKEGACGSMAPKYVDPEHGCVYFKDIKPSVTQDFGLKMVGISSIMCPVVGWMPAYKCQKLGEYHNGCPYYGGIKMHIDVAGNKYNVVICNAINHNEE